jgi:hypothetical protein
VPLKSSIQMENLDAWGGGNREKERIGIMSKLLCMERVGIMCKLCL